MGERGAWFDGFEELNERPWTGRSSGNFALEQESTGEGRTVTEVERHVSKARAELSTAAFSSAGVDCQNRGVKEEMTNGSKISEE